MAGLPARREPGSPPIRRAVGPVPQPPGGQTLRHLTGGTRGDPAPPPCALAALLDDSPSADRTLKAITCAWSATPSPTPRDTAVTAAVPEAVHWRSDDLATDPGFHSWQHHYVSRTHLDDPALDQLLLCVADDMTDGVILTDATCAWIFHPYDGGADVFAGSVEARDRLAAAFADWLGDPVGEVIRQALGGARRDRPVLPRAG